MADEASPTPPKPVHKPVTVPECAHTPELLSPDHYGDIIYVVVNNGEDKRTFPIYEGLLKHYSRYFANAVKKEWMGTESRTIEIHDDPETFRAFFHWLLSGELYSKLTEEGKIPLSFKEICNIYIFGKFREIPELCNAAMDLCLQKCGQDWMRHSYSLGFIYDNTNDGAALRRFMVDLGVEKSGLKFTRKQQSALSKEYLLDTLQKIANDKVSPNSCETMTTGKYLRMKSEQMCDKYHDHDFPKGSQNGV